MINKRKIKNYEPYKRHCMRMNEHVLSGMSHSMLMRKAQESHDQFMKDILK